MKVMELDGGLTGEVHPATERVLIAREQFGPKTATGRIFGWPESGRGSGWKVFPLGEPAWRNPFDAASPSEEYFAEGLYYHYRRYMLHGDALLALGDLAWLVPFYRAEHTKKARLARKKKMPAARPPQRRHGSDGSGSPATGGDTDDGAPTHDEEPLSEAALVSDRAAHWARATGGDLAALIADIDPATLDDGETVEYLKATARMVSWAESKRVGALHRFTEHRPNPGEPGNHQPWSRYAATEVAAALSISHGSAATQLVKAHCLCSYMPHTYAALGEGTIDMARANKMMLHLPPLHGDEPAQYERQLLDIAAGLSPAQLEKQAMRVANEIHPVSAEERHESAAQDRTISFAPMPDAMVEMYAYLPAAEATAIEALLEQTARSLQGPAETRTLAQLKTDVFTDLALGGHTADAANAGKVNTEVLITIPALTLMGHTDQPGDLEGYGPIPADIARQLAGDSNSWYRVLTDPWKGSVLAHGRKHKKPPKDLKRLLRARDGRCRFPGCNRRPAGCDIDHTTAREHGGRTDHDNLCHLCPLHHKAKHEGDWRVKQLDGGIMRWTAPTGHVYDTAPDYTSAPVPQDVLDKIEEPPPF
ncbi:HNH endonuclease [Arthrobacter castelli]|uniref:HNH endonuclease n=1 Tax=Arthrobacter castelli TaxID=271431 RepID=UPI0003FF0D89|nr:HNH endonuclease signature motif containing protein [Arthrobacter castelli]